MIGFQYLANVATLKLAPERCIGCGMCVEVCPHQVFRLAGKKAEIGTRDACMECGACAVNCPAAAIHVDAGVGCASGMINEWLAGVVGNKGGGCC
ncbi:MULTISPECIES: mercury methylation ferredoxin HgcB [Geobacter]|uniref:Ferredoxin n=2 Tax=Geobacter TaxID=28231 RepID=A0A0C1TP09_9BACT|nr:MULTISPECIES: mercury methylation ferredoxin HgcB [Geobacter]ANA40535.1 ferredoxin [Geobacter anodireducens]KIE42569.1 ferredoxin [Geobacter soli]MBE2887589.1 4Fe-4S binding protein [Geobacter anodireducens]HMN02335.1 mercury methylation ferredoxin HgcB [Geobacter anodireducens]